MVSFKDFIITILAIIVLTIVCAALSALIFAAWCSTFIFSGWIAFIAVPLTYFCWWIIAKIFNTVRIFK